MNTRLFALLGALALTLATTGSAPAQDNNPKPATDAPQPPLSAAEQKFKTLCTKATLTGRWAPLKDGKLEEEKQGDSYSIVSASKVKDDNWVISAKMKYRDREFVLPVPVKMQFAGDTAVMLVDNFTMTYGGSYSARLLFYDNTYTGTWKGGDHGGLLYGVITNEK